MTVEVLIGIAATVASALIIAGILATARFLFQLRDLVRHEARPNGGSSAKDYMDRTTRALEALQAQQAGQQVEQARQTAVLQGIHSEMQEHNELTGQMVRGMIEGRGR